MLCSFMNAVNSCVFLRIPLQFHDMILVLDMVVFGDSV